MTLVLSSDEVRVISRLAGAPGLLPEDSWDADDLPVADVVATRALLARDLVRLDAEPLPGLVLAPRARELFAGTGTVVSVIRDAAAGSWRATLAGTLLAKEITPEVWALSGAGHPGISDLTGELLGTVTSPGTGVPLRIPTAALTAADRIADHSTVDSLGEFLGTYGIEPAIARAVAHLLHDRDAVSTVRRTTQTGTRVETESLTWLEVGTRGWLVTADEAGDGPEDVPEAVTCLSPTDGDALRGALDRLLTEERQ
jgi:hypothetical protein